MKVRSSITLPQLMAPIQKFIDTFNKGDSARQAGISGLGAVHLRFVTSQ
jgi:hypothetical protein